MFVRETFIGERFASWMAQSTQSPLILQPLNCPLKNLFSNNICRIDEFASRIVRRCTQSKYHVDGYELLYKYKKPHSKCMNEDSKINGMSFFISLHLHKRIAKASIVFHHWVVGKFGPHQIILFWCNTK